MAFFVGCSWLAHLDGSLAAHLYCPPICLTLLSHLSHRPTRWVGLWERPSDWLVVVVWSWKNIFTKVGSCHSSAPLKLRPNGTIRIYLLLLLFMWFMFVLPNTRFGPSANSKCKLPVLIKAFLLSAYCNRELWVAGRLSFSDVNF